ncbi:LamG-like jellyroll fold domain-containing protein, partial [Accumulibacter sp.]|uniref:beta strand repeat-containing protein n=1 Tax=Accumulibacter sp. TaxID=2053492 RepID=UPI0028785A71
MAIGSGLDQAFAVALQSDGKIVVAGNSYNGTDTDFAVLRLNTDGSLDTTFSGDGKVTTDLALGNDDANSVLIQSDGKIVVTGSADNGVSYDFAAVRYNTNGTLDTSFSIDGKVTTFFGVNHDESWDSLLQSDGKIVLVGSTNLGASDDFAILRYNTDGTLDTTFSGDGKQTASFGGNLDVAYSVVQQADGKLVLAGKYFNGSSYAFAVSRLTTTGSLDTTFSGDGLQLVDVSASADAAYSVALQSDGAIVLAGPSGSGSTDDFAVVRLTTAGALDTTFSSDGMLTTALGGLDQAASVVVQSDGAIVVAGVSSSNFALVRYGSTGTLDATLGATNTLDGAPSHTEGGSPVVLDGNVQVFDAELSAAGNYSGATLTLARHGGANAQDVFSATGVLSSIAAASGNVVVSGTTIGTYTNSPGTLVFTFNASATQTRVNSAMQAIAYSNSSDAPPASVQIDWTFNDGNTGAQGTGGALSATGSTTVSITAVNDPPANSVPGAQSTNEDTNKVFSAGNGNAIAITDPDASGAAFEVTLSVTNGTLTLAGTSGLAFTVGDGGADTTMTFSGTVANINTALDGLTFSPTTNFTGGATLTLATADSVLTSLDIDANLHARYTFENSASDVAPGTTQNGVLGGDANYAVDATRGRVLGLDGAGDYVSIADTSSFRALTQGTIASWLKFTDTGFRVIFSVTDGASNQNYLNLFVNNGKLGAQTVDGNSWIFETVSTATINDGNWHHVAFTVNGSGNQLYIDGTAAARTFNQGNAATSSFYASLNSVTSVTIGATYTLPGSYLSGFSGQIDDLRVYSRALTAGELSLLAADQSLTDSDAVAITVSAANDAPTFAIGTGIVTTNVTPAADQGNAVIAQSDGKLLVAGEGNGDFVLVRYKTDGTLDTTFGGGDGMVSTGVGAGSDFASSLALQADGKIVVAGYASNGSNDDFALVRYNPDGSLDTDFGTGGKVTTAIGAGDDRAQGVAVQSNGRIVLAGYSYNGSNNDFAVVRYNSDGTLDTTFSGDGKLTTAISTSNDDGYAVLVQSDGKIVVVGSSLIGGTNWDFAAARYNSDGTLDTSFSGDGLANFAVGTGHDYACGVALQPDGKLVLAGYGVNGATSDFAVVRLNSSGTLDTSFSGDGKLFTAIGASEDLATSVTLQTDDKIVLAGTYANGANTDLAVARYNVDGSLDTSFDSDGIKTLALPAGSNQVTGVAVSNGRIVAVGTTQSKLAAVFLGTNGTPEATIGAVNTLDGAPTYTEGGAPAVLDANVQIFDAELSANNNFSGATLTLTRNGGANAQDVFSASGTLATLTQGGNLSVGGTTIGTVTTNSGGTALLSFNGSATNALVNSAMQQIAYSNTSDAPAASVQINWTVNDGNSGSQGSGGALTATGSTTVSITAVNDAPVLADTVLTLSVAEDAAVPSGAAGSLLSAFTGGISDVDSGALKGVAITATSETNGTWYYSTNGGTNWSTVGVVSNTSALLLADDGNTRLYYTPNANYNGTASSALTLRAWDRSSGSAGSKVDTSSNGGSTAYSSATDVVDVTVTAINDAPTFGVGAGGRTLPAGSVGGEAYSVVVQADGKIITAGYRNDAGQLDIQLIRCNADGSVDTGFGNNGSVVTAIGAGGDFAWEMALQADGKILVAGESYNGSNSDFALVRYNTDGSLDASFGSGGKVTTAIGSGNEQAMGLAVQADGRIVLAGWSGSDFALARYNTDGSLDAGFGAGGKVVTSYGANSGAYSVAVQPDGKIVLAGSIWNGSNYDVAVLRYNTNGTLDAGFGSAGKVTTAVGTGHDFSYGLALQADGRIVLTGSTSNGGTSSVLVLRYNVDGSLDTSFNGTGKVSTAVGSYGSYCEGVAIQPDGKIVVVGAARNASNTYDDSLVLRYNTDGSLDTSFNGSGKLTSELSSADDRFYDLALQPAGTIVAAGYATINGTQEFLLARYTASDILDPTFGTILGPLDGAPSYTEGGSAVVLDSDVRVYDAELSAADNFSGATLTLSRNGGANPQDVFSASGTLAALTQGGNLTVGGTTIGTVTTNSAGTLLLSFNGNATNALLDSALQQIAYSNSSDTPPASVQIDWTFSDGNSGAQGSGGALTATGSTTVSITAVNDAPVLADTALTLSVAEDAAAPSGTVGSLLSAFTGGISDVDSGALKGIAIIASNESNGTWYYSTNGGTNWSTVGSVSAAQSLLLADDGNTRLYLKPGADYSGSSSSALTLRAWDRTSGSAGTKVDTSSNGSSTPYSSATDVVDVTVSAVNDPPTFSVGDGVVSTAIGTGTDYAYSVVIQADGKILLAGNSVVSGFSDFALVRYNSDGSLDTSFSSDGKLTTSIGAFDDYGKGVAVQADGKILVTGYTYNGSNDDIALTRYNSDGTLDTTFSGDGMLTTAIGTSNDYAYSVTVQSDGKILVAGNAFMGTDYDFVLVRYNSDGTLDTTFDGDGKLTTPIGANDDYGISVVTQPDGKILLSGRSLPGASNDFALVRYNADGALDTSFSGDGKLTTSLTAGTDNAWTMALQSDGRIVLGGWATPGANRDFGLVRYNSDGTLDTSFSGDGIVTTAIGNGNDDLYSIAVQADGRIVAAGFSSNGSNNDFALVRYNSDGTLDTSFSGDGILTTAIGSAADEARSVALQSNGRIVVGGSSVVGNNDFALVRYNTDGTLDASFATVNTLDGAPTYTEGGAAVVLDADAAIFDAELSPTNFNGASLTLSRNGGANPQDVFSASGTLGSLTQGDNLNVGGTTIGTVTTNGAGTLLLSFNASATNALVNSALQQIAYSNSSDTPPASVQIDWTFSDGNAGAQGSGGALADVGHTTVTITATNDAPTGSVTIDDTTPAQGQTLTASNTLADADGLG